MLFEELDEYKITDHFFFRSDDSLKEVCNAPSNTSGVYVVYALAFGKIELIYIGSSGKMQKNGYLKHRKDGLFGRIVKGIQFDANRSKSWSLKMEEEQIEALDIYWFETFNDQTRDIPRYIEAILIQKHFDIFGVLPRWNKEF